MPGIFFLISGLNYLEYMILEGKKGVTNHTAILKLKGRGQWRAGLYQTLMNCRFTAD